MTPLQSSDFKEPGCLSASRHLGWDSLKTLSPVAACGILVENKNNAFPVLPRTGYVCYSYLTAQCHLTLISLQAKLMTKGRQRSPNLSAVALDLCSGLGLFGQVCVRGVSVSAQALKFEA